MAKGCTIMESMQVRLWLRVVQLWKVCRSDYGEGLYNHGKYVGQIMAKGCTVMESMQVRLWLRVVELWKICRSDLWLRVVQLWKVCRSDYG